MEKTFGDKKLTISTMSAKDLKCAKEYTDFINDLIAEGAKLSINVKQNMKGQTAWLETTLKEVKNKEKVFLIARDGKRIAGNTSFHSFSFSENHIADMGIAIAREYRSAGLGEYLVAEIMRLAKKELKPTPKFFQLEVYENNAPAIALYKKMGFKIVAKLPKQIQWKSKLIGTYIMMRQVK